MLKALLSIIVLGAVVTGCGSKEGGIPFTQPQGSEQLPKSIENRLESLEDGKSTTTKSSQNIKEETIGLNVDITHRDSKVADIRVTVSYSEGAGTCSQALYHVKDFLISKYNSKFRIDGFGEITCHTMNKSTKRCDYLFVKITQTPSSILAAVGSSPKETLIPASVYAIMKNISSNPKADTFIPSRTDRDNYLQIPEGTNDYQYCMKPQQLTQEATDVTYIVDPNGDLSEDDYYEYNGYNFGNGFN